MQDSLQPSGGRRGELWAAGMVIGYASANIFDRVAVIHSDPLIGPLLRGLPSLLLGILLVWRNRTLNQLRPGASGYVGRRAIISFVLAGLLSTLGLFAYYYAIKFGGVIITIPVLETYVIWGTLIAWFFLKERFHGFVLLGIVLITLGLGALSWGQLRGHPISPHWYWAIPLAFFTALTYGVSGVLWRDGQLRGTHQSAAILLQFVTSVLVAVVGLVALGGWRLIVTTAPRDLAALVASGILSGIVGIYCLFTALRLMAVARVYAYSALTPLLAALFARLFLDEYLNLLMLLGVILVCAGVTLTQIYRPKEERQAS